MQAVSKNKTRDILLETTEFEVLPIFKAALKIYFTRFLSFTMTSTVIVTIFLLIALGLFYGYGHIGDVSLDNVVNILQRQDIFNLKDKSLFIIPIAWVFFSWLRISYLIAANGYFTKSNSLVGGLDKLISFMLIELMRIVILVLGLVLFPILPFIVIKYFISSAVLASQNEGGINSMFESGEYVEGKMFSTMGCAFFLNVVIMSLMLGCFIVSDFFIKDPLILWSLNVLLFIFIFLPIHACYRFMVFKKLQFLDGELRVQETALQKFWFVFLRLALFGTAVVCVVMTANGKMSGFISEFIFKMVGV